MLAAEVPIPIDDAENEGSQSLLLCLRKGNEFEVTHEIRFNVTGAVEIRVGLKVGNRALDLIGIACADSDASRVAEQFIGSLLEF
jgi:hypothetical protein